MAEQQDDVSSVASAVRELARVINPLVMMGERPQLEQIQRGLQHLLERRAALEGRLIIAAGDDRQEHAIRGALTIVDALADSQPVTPTPVARCRFCQALAPETPSLWTDPAWHELGICLWAQAVINRARRDALGLR